MSNPNPKCKINAQNASLYGKKSGEARRQKKEFRFLLETILDMPEVNENVCEALKKMGFVKKDMTNRLTIAVNLANKAKGNDARFARLFFDMHGDLNKEEGVCQDDKDVAMQEFEVIYSKPTNTEGSGQSSD